VTLDRTFYSLIFKKEAVAAPLRLPRLLPNFFPYRISRFPEEAFIRNIILLCINYIICINNNAAINNSGRLEDLILPFKIPMGTRKNFFEVYGQFRCAPSKGFARPGLCRLFDDSCNGQSDML
jgi:hypothetical protein